MITHVFHVPAFGSIRSDWAKALLANQGVDQRRFYITGRGEEDPIASNATESGRAQNRRVEIQLSPIEG